jgi:hypothetical protein
LLCLPSNIGIDKSSRITLKQTNGRSDILKFRKRNKNILKVTIGLKQADAFVSVYCLTVLVSLKTKKKKSGIE